MDKVLFDTNIILDLLLQRVPHLENAKQLFGLIDTEAVEAYITANTITDIYYIARKEKGKTQTLEFIANLVELFEIIGIHKTIIVDALKSNLKDFEDAIQISAADYNSLDCIITRNIKDFVNTKINIFTPEEYLSK